MVQPTQGAPHEQGAPHVTNAEAPAVFTPHACSSSSTTSSSSSSNSSSSRGGLLSRQVTVGIRFRPPPRSSVSPASRMSPPSSEAPPSVPAATAASQSAGGSSGEGCGGPSLSTSSLPGPLVGAPSRGHSCSRALVRRPPWARRGPTDEEWAFVDGEGSGWVLVVPWALDLGAPSEEVCSEGGPASLARGPHRVWDGYKDVCYEADYVFGPEALNAEVYVHLVKDLVSAALTGRNAAFLAYGQTASGKTHTMFGGGPPARGSLKGASSQRGGPPPSSQVGDDSEGPPSSKGPAEKGVTELALADIFEEQAKLDQKDRFSVSLSMLEVYQETVFDVLLEASGGRHPGGGAPSQSAGGPLLEGGRQKRSIALCEAPDGSLNMGSLGAHKVGSLSEALALVKRGLQQRQAASTTLNPRSSRSHAVLRIILTPPPPAAAAAAAPPAVGDWEEVAAAAAGATAPAEATAAAAATAEAAESSAAAEAGALPKAAAAAPAGGLDVVAAQGPDACRAGFAQGPLKPCELLAEGKGAPPASRCPRRPSVLSLVDLAGSEGARVASTVGKMQREGGAINRSLLALSRVVKALTRQQQQQQQEGGPAQANSKASRSSTSVSSLQAAPVGGGRPHRQGASPFLGLRESKLTRLLSDCLGGPCLTSLLCLCAPGGPSYRHTAATLAFARRARRLPPAQEVSPEGPPKLKRLRSNHAPNADTAAAAAGAAAVGSGGSNEATETAEGGGEGCCLLGGGPQPTGAPGGPPRPFVYLPTGCVQCHALHKALKKAREELACQAVQLRQLRYVISRTPSLAAAAAAAATAAGATPLSSSSGSSRGRETIGDKTPRKREATGESRTDEGGPPGALLQRTPSHPHQENQIPKHVLPPLNYGGGVSYKPPLPGSLGAPPQDKGAPASLLGGPPPMTPADSHKALAKGPSKRAAAEL
ncbi:hypothetical protein Esti_001587 [Eimeria stiedai]